MTHDPTTGQRPWRLPPAGRFARVTMLDDAREGMNPDIRIQDDLFGHVNGAWLDTAEIPADRAVVGALRAARRHRRGAGARDHRGLRRRRRSTGDEATEDRRPVRQLHGRGPHRGARPHPDPAAARGDRRARRPRLAGQLPRRPSSDAAAAACSAPTSTPTTATPSATSSTCSRAASGCPTRATTARRSSPRSARSTSPTSSASSPWPSAPTPPAPPPG